MRAHVVPVAHVVSSSSRCWLAALGARRRHRCPPAFDAQHRRRAAQQHPRQFGALPRVREVLDALGSLDSRPRFLPPGRDVGQLKRLALLAEPPAVTPVPMGSWGEPATRNVELVGLRALCPSAETALPTGAVVSRCRYCRARHLCRWPLASVPWRAPSPTAASVSSERRRRHRGGARLRYDAVDRGRVVSGVGGLDRLEVVRGEEGQRSICRSELCSGTRGARGAGRA